MTHCLIIGGTGYIGSRLYRELVSLDHTVETIDLEWFGNSVNPKNIRLDYRRLEPSIIANAKALILLAGHSSVGMAEGNFADCFENNVVNFQSLIERLKPDQKLIYASSASVYGYADGEACREDDPAFSANNAYDVSKHMIDLMAPLSDVEFYGLRLGTVCGYSPNLRTDVVINAMFSSARSAGHVKLFNPNARRSILGLSDLCKSVQRIIETPIDHRGLYNLASVSTTVREAAVAVANQLEVPVLEPEPDLRQLPPTPYSFQLDCSKFQRTFGLKPSDDLDSIVSELVASKETPVLCNRLERRAYAPPTR